MGWMNDELYVRFGVAKANPASGGSPSVDGRWNIVEAEIADFSDLTTTAQVIGTEGGSDAFGVVIPAGARIEKVELVMETAAVTGTSLDVGLLLASDRATGLDEDGLIAAGATATFDADGDIVEYIQGSTGHGALIGTTLSANGVLVASHNTTAYTVGKGTVRVYYTNV